MAALFTMLLASQQADAQSCGYGRGYYGGRVGGYTSYYGSAVRGGYYGGGRNYGMTFTTRRPVSRYPRHTYHDTSHYDYYPSRIVPHGDHLDYIPGHYRYHQTGHIHHNHR